MNDTEQREIRSRAELHALRPGSAVLTSDTSDTVTLCRIWASSGFWGTGSQEEYEKAEGLRLCKACTKQQGGAA